MKVLGIHHFAPPVAVAASRRLYLLYKALAAQGASLHLITAQQHQQRPLEAAYQHPWPLYPVASRGLREVLRPTGSTSLPISWKTRIGLPSLLALKHSFPFLYLTDEGGPTYRKAAYQRGCELIAREGITHLLSSYRPWADHLVAAQLKARHPHLHWIADFRDLPVDPVRKDVCWPSAQTYWARRVLRSASEVWAVSEGQAQWLSALHTNIKVVYSGLETLPKASASQTNIFLINYTGSLYANWQSIAPLAQAIRQLEEERKKAGDPSPLPLKIRYAGKDGELFYHWARTQQIAHLVEIEAAVPLAAALQRQRSATLNLLLTWSAPNYYGVLTAKLFDYLAAGRPILALVNGPDDPELSQLFHRSGAGFLQHQQQPEEQLYQWLHTLYHRWQKQGGQLNWAMQTNALAPFLYHHYPNEDRSTPSPEGA